MYGASNSQSCMVGSVAQSISQGMGRSSLLGGTAAAAMTPGGSWRGWSRA